MFTFYIAFYITSLLRTVKQKAQLSLEQPTALVVSDLQGHPRSMIFISSERAYMLFPISDNSNLGHISHRFRNMVSSPLKTRIFSTPPFNPKFENVPLALNR